MTPTNPAQAPVSRRRVILALGGLIVSSLAVVVVLTAALVPQFTNPAYDSALAFVLAAGRGDEAAALAELSAGLRAYATATCRDGQVTRCIQDYTPPAWGRFLNAVFRRGQPDGADAWDVQLIATYAEDKGFSGVCIYTRVERSGSDWQVTRWSGWIHCGEPNSGLSALMAASAPNAAP